jgi:hypothetical protein
MLQSRSRHTRSLRNVHETLATAFERPDNYVLQKEREIHAWWFRLVEHTIQSHPELRYGEDHAHRGTYLRAVQLHVSNLMKVFLGRALTMFFGEQHKELNEEEMRNARQQPVKLARLFCMNSEDGGGHMFAQYRQNRHANSWHTFDSIFSRPPSRRPASYKTRGAVQTAAAVEERRSKAYTNHDFCMEVPLWHWTDAKGNGCIACGAAVTKKGTNCYARLRTDPVSGS